MSKFDHFSMWIWCGLSRNLVKRHMCVVCSKELKSSVIEHTLQHHNLVQHVEVSSNFLLNLFFVIISSCFIFFFSASWILNLLFYVFNNNTKCTILYNRRAFTANQIIIIINSSLHTQQIWFRYFVLSINVVLKMFFKMLLQMYFL